MSFLRKQESITSRHNWTPACAEVTNWELLEVLLRMYWVPRTSVMIIYKNGYWVGSAIIVPAQAEIQLSQPLTGIVILIIFRFVLLRITIRNSYKISNLCGLNSITILFIDHWLLLWPSSAPDPPAPAPRGPSSSPDPSPFPEEEERGQSWYS